MNVRSKRQRFFLNPFEKLNINKRQRYIIGVVFLSLGLFLSEYLLGKSGFAFSILLAFVADVFILWANHDDIKENMFSPIFILPFFFSLSFALFYFLVPNRLLARVIITSLYAVGLYSLFLSQNIFTVASIRTIALLSSARTVSFILTLVSYFFLANIIFSLDLSLIPTSAFLLAASFFLILHSIWTYTLDQKFFSQFLWVLALAFCIVEMSLILWFWPSNPTIIALFLTGFFYTLVGLSHVWFEKRLFRGIIWEYVWVAVVVSIILILSTSWRG
ncbi:MAG: hypothetical protein Q8P10_02605 [bacterium]|nr:hypothetical protein [bacterium]